MVRQRLRRRTREIYRRWSGRRDVPPADIVVHLLYSNRGGERFEDRTDAAGLRSHLATSTYVYVDLDDDGDLDIASVAVDGPIWVYRNHQSQANRAIAFELRDAVGNRYGVGSRVVIHYGPGAERRQMRELKGSGGFLSFDPPSLHFGLSEFDDVARIEIYWSTGERSALRGPFKAGRRYRITRRAGSGFSKETSQVEIESAR